MPNVGKTCFVSRSNVSQLVFLFDPPLLHVSCSSLLCSNLLCSALFSRHLSVHLNFISQMTGFSVMQQLAERGGLLNCLNSNQPLLHSGEEQRHPPARKPLCTSVSPRGKAAVFPVAHIDSVFNKHNSNVKTMQSIVAGWQALSQHALYYRLWCRVVHPFKTNIYILWRHTRQVQISVFSSIRCYTATSLKFEKNLVMGETG